MVPAARTRLADAVRRRRVEKFTSIIANELIVKALGAFLEQHYAAGSERLLDLGAGAKPYAPLYEPYFRSCTALDVDHSPHDTSDVDVIAPAERMPFEDASFDCVIATEVLEHCPDPAAVMAEIARVLRPGGRALVTTPFLLGLHEMPHDYYRYTPPALRLLAGQAGLQVESIEPRGDLVAVTLGALLYFAARPFAALGGWFFRYRNPLVWLLVVAPQLLYLRYWERSPGRAQSKLADSPTGYMTVLARR